MTTKTLVNIADLVDRTDSKGRTFRQINADRKHTIAIGSLVELDVSNT